MSTLLDDLRALDRSGRNWFMRWTEAWKGGEPVAGWRASMWVSLTTRLDSGIHERYEDAIAELVLCWGLAEMVEQQARAAGLVS